MRKGRVGGESRDLRERIKRRKREKGKRRKRTMVKSKRIKSKEINIFFV